MVTFGIKGAGGLRPGEGRNRVFCFWRRGVSATRCFLPAQKILFLAKVIKFWNTENMGNYSMCANFKRVFPKMYIFGISKSIFSYIFWDKCMKLESYVLGTKTKILIEPIFDLGLRFGNIEILKCPPFQKSSKMKSIEFQNSVFPLLRPKSKIS